MLSGNPRTDRIYILTVDQVLAADIRERILQDPRMEDYVVVRPESLDPRIAVEEVERMAVESRTGRLLIFDVRAQTLPWLQKAYNAMVGLNRMDFNSSCFTLLIGDGPLTLFEPGKNIGVFRSLLAKLRLDYESAAFFYDPFLHYTFDERKTSSMERGGKLLQAVPRRLAEILGAEHLEVSDLRRYFRAADVPPAERPEERARRQERLLRFFEKRIGIAFPQEKQELASWLSKEGYFMGSETLRLHLYPLYFEDWVFDLMQEAMENRQRPGRWTV